MKKEPIVIFGCGGHATSVAESVLSCGYDIGYFVDQRAIKREHLGYPVKSSLEAATNNLQVVVAVGVNFQRSLIVNKIRSQFDHVTFPVIIHEDASISRFASIGEGSVVLQNAVVGANTTIGNFCIANSLVSLDHDCHLDDFASLAPGSVIGGGVSIGERSVIGIGAVVKHDVTIGSDAVVGANSYVNTDCVKDTVYFGSPARRIRKRHREDPYL